MDLIGPAQFVNLFLFFVGVSLVLAAVLLVMATAPIKARWDTYANAPLAVRTRTLNFLVLTHMHSRTRT